MRPSNEGLSAPLSFRQRIPMRDSHAKGVKIYRFRCGQTPFSGVFEAKLFWHHLCLAKSSACGWRANPSTSSNMNNNLAASGKLCSLLTSGALFVFWMGLRGKSGSRVGGTSGGVPGCLLTASQGDSAASGSGWLQLFWRAARPQRVFLLLYLTRVMVLDNRHGLP